MKKIIENYKSFLSSEYSMFEMDLEKETSFSICMVGDVGEDVESILTLSIDKSGNETVVVGYNFIPLESSSRKFNNDLDVIEGFTCNYTNYNVMTFSGVFVGFDRKGSMLEQVGLGMRRENSRLSRFEYIKKELDDLDKLHTQLLNSFGSIENCFASAESIEKSLIIGGSRANPFSLARGFVWFKNIVDKNPSYDLIFEIGNIVNEGQIDYPLTQYKDWLEREEKNKETLDQHEE